MDVKKYLVILTLIALGIGFASGMLVKTVMGVPLPYPISVKLITNIPTGASGVEVRISDMTLGTEKVYYTNGFGEIMLDASDFSGFRTSDTFKAVVSVCSSNSGCTQQTTLDSGSISFLFDLTHKYCFPNPPPQTVTVTKYACYNGSSADSASACPVQPPVVNNITTTVTTYVCSDGSTRSTNDCPALPATTVPITDTIFGVIIGAVGVYLVKKYVPYKGKMRTTWYQDAAGKAKVKTEKYEKYVTALGKTAYHWVIVQDVYV